MNFTREENKVLSEIYRRLNYLKGGNLDEKLLLLALPSFAKTIQKYGLIKPYSSETPRQANWYNLTDKGKYFFKNYIQDISEEKNLDLFNQVCIKFFDKKFLN